MNSTTFHLPCRRRFGATWNGENFVVGPQKSHGFEPCGKMTTFCRLNDGYLWAVGHRSSKPKLSRRLRQAPCLTHRPKPGKCARTLRDPPVTSNHQDILTNVLGTKIILRNQPLTFYDPKPFSSAYHLQSRVMWTHVLLIQNFEVNVILVSISTYVHLYTQASFEKTHRPRVI